MQKHSTSPNCGEQTRRDKKGDAIYITCDDEAVCDDVNVTPKFTNKKMRSIHFKGSYINDVTKFGNLLDTPSQHMTLFINKATVLS